MDRTASLTDPVEASYAAVVSTVTLPANRLPPDWSIGDLVTHLGVPPERIRLYPPPGMATVEDAIRATERKEGICELVDGVLVEKAMGYLEGRLAAVLIYFIETYLDSRRLGCVNGADGMLRLWKDQLRIPDVSFIRWERLPQQRVPDEPAPLIAPDLAVEILSKTNTPSEMERKLREYFTSGARLVWYIDPPTRTARAYTAVDAVEEIGPDGVLDGGSVLPEFRVALRELFERAEGPGAGRDRQ